MGSVQTVRKKQLKRILKIFWIFILIFSLSSCDEKENISNEQISSTDETYTKAQVIRVIDGDTIWVDIGDRKEKVRFIGINTPELARDGKKAQFMAEEAKDFVEKTIKDKEIYLEKDLTDRDKYDRLLRYIYLEKPSENPSFDEIRDKSLNGILVKEGLAYSNYYKPNIKYQDFLEKLEDEARENKLGIHSKKNRK